MSNESSVADWGVAAEIRRGVTRLARRMRLQRPPGGLTGNELGVLSHLRTHGPSSPGDIAAAEHQQPQSLTRVLAGLETAGLIQRSTNAKDRRGSILDLTEPGRTALVEDMAHRDAWLFAALAERSEVEIELLRLAAALMNQLADSSLTTVDVV